MRLSWNEVRIRAARFADEWRDAAYEKGETQSFYNAFFEIFDVRRRSVARYEEHVRKLDNRSGFIDLFWPGFLILDQDRAQAAILDAPTGKPGSTSTAYPSEIGRAISWSATSRASSFAISTRVKRPLSLWQTYTPMSRRLASSWA